MTVLPDIGTPDALGSVRAALGRTPVAAEALLVSADRLRAKSRDAEAVKLFDEVRASRAAGTLLPATRGAPARAMMGGVVAAHEETVGVCTGVLLFILVCDL